LQVVDLHHAVDLNERRSMSPKFPRVMRAVVDHKDLCRPR